MEIGLADALRALRRELAEAALEADGDSVRLHVEQVDLNLEVSVQRAREAGGGVRFWVVSADAKTSGATTVTHTVSLRLTAETAGGGRVLTGDGGVALGDE
ncbi:MULTISPECIES: trypco2 family protein [Streptomyces]|uniref:trypco2 family protein n=1 Tax=Streptomyces TaxID=1883 RepID=UPI000DD58954|nr:MULTISPECIES: trypco2 family protein [Streptomyces]MDX3387851.1 hypothetical protein [Streptomyces niveiscabiei]QZZ28657.1 hypothetical protein A7X85_22400 [Streptomyces sp. ST1015]